MRVKYEDWNPDPATVVVVGQANQIASDYRQQGYDLTLRQLYYQFVSRDLIPNTDRSYKRLGSIVNRARLAGLMDWSYIVDRTRGIANVGYPVSEEEALRSVPYLHSVDHWQGQDDYVEVWVEKEALAGVVARAAEAWDTPFFSCRGYPSQSEVWAAAQRLLQQVVDGKRVTILHLGDHDPSGIDMTRDIRDRLATFTEQDFVNAHDDEVAPSERGDPSTFLRRSIRDAMSARTAYPDLDAIEVRRIALNMDQIQEYDPPPNPAKMTDSRVAGYIDAYGSSSWELDALEPAMLDDLIRTEIAALIDHDEWAAREAEQEAGRARLQSVSDRYQEIIAGDES